MSLLSLQPPVAFLDCPGEPKTPFDAWEKLFQNYLLAIGGEEFSAERKRALLIHCLGTEGQRIYNTLPLTADTYNGSLQALKQFFSPKLNVVSERYRFRQRGQAVGESTDHYVAALRELVRTCAFGDMEHEMVRDQIVEKTCMPRIRERLLLEPELTLEKSLTIARQIEAAVADAKVIAEGESKHVSAIQKQTNVNSRMQKSKQRSKPREDRRIKGQQQCYRCGSTHHLANDKSCPAKDCKCRMCGKIGHFSKVCKSSSKSVNEVSLPEVTVLSVNDCNTDEGAPMGTFTVATSILPAQSCTIKMMVDTGSGASILPLKIYKEHFNSCALSPPKVQLLNYSRDKIPVCGSLTMNVTYYGKTVVGEFNIVKSGTPLIGRDICKTLDIEIKGGRLIEPVTHCAMLQLPSSLPTCTDTPASTLISKGFGCAKDFIHKVKVRTEVKPVQQKVRHLPLSVRAAVSEELKTLEENGIIEKIDSSEWVSPIVVTKRKNDTIRMCVDLREPNKAVVPDSHPLPLIEDILSALHGSVMFSSLDLKNAYYQLKLHEESRGLTAFITHEGLYQFCRVPYGLCSAPSAFQRMMSMILKGLEGVQCYLDDVIVHGASEAIHNANLKAVLHRISEAGLKLNPDKCKLSLTSLSFLGYRLSAAGLHPDDTHTTAITNAPRPTDAATLRSFLGLTAWYSKFVPAYATLVEPMRALLRRL